MRRVICNRPIVFWRGSDGKPHALEDRCCHRHMPLSDGRLIGDALECPYHGLQYDAAGACIKIPSQPNIPPQAHVRAYPVFERHRWIWIWMGEPALADPNLIEDFHWLDDPKWRAKPDLLHLEGSYLLLVENLLDLTHLQFVHRTTLGTEAIAGAPINTERDGNRVRVTRWMLDSPPPPFFQRAGGFRPDQKIDRWQIIDYTPPAFVRLDVGGALAGTGAQQGDRSKGFSMRNLNAITPETETTTHYFWAQAHDFAIDDPSVTELLFRQVRTAFFEDLGIIKSQQRNLTDFGDHLPQQIDFKQDAGAVQARRIVDAIMTEERAGRAKAAE
jgi:vanillate O-demethylase monooxygenase subunit